MSGAMAAVMMALHLHAGAIHEGRRVRPLHLAVPHDARSRPPATQQPAVSAPERRRR